MKRGLLILMLCMAFGLTLEGTTLSTDVPRVSFGVEWGYIASFYNGHHNYFIAPEGYRVEDKNSKAIFCSNGEVNLHAGCNLNAKWNMSLYVGYAGIGDYHTGLPVSLRMTRYFGADPMADRWFAYCDLGSGISFKEHPQELLTGKIGGGYRLSMSRYTKLDFIAALRFVHTHPDVYHYNETIEKHSINRNSGYLISASFGIGITF